MWYWHVRRLQPIGSKLYWIESDKSSSLFSTNLCHPREPHSSVLSHSHKNVFRIQSQMIFCENSMLRHLRLCSIQWPQKYYLRQKRAKIILNETNLLFWFWKQGKYLRHLILEICMIMIVKLEGGVCNVQCCSLPGYPLSVSHGVTTTKHGWKIIHFAKNPIWPVDSLKVQGMWAWLLLCSCLPHCWSYYYNSKLW